MRLYRSKKTIVCFIILMVLLTSCSNDPTQLIPSGITYHSSGDSIEYSKPISKEDIYPNLAGMAENRDPDKSAGSFAFWKFRGNVHSFSVNDDDKLEVSSDSIRFTAGAKGSLKSPAGLNAPAKAVRTIEIRLKTDNSDLLSFLWKTDSSDDMNVNKVSVDLINDGKFHDYQIDLVNVGSWKGVIDRVMLSVPQGKSIIIEYIRLTGVYLVPFPWLSGDFTKDIYRLQEIKKAFTADHKTVTVGFSALVQYLSDTDANDDLLMQDRRSVDYYIKLAKAADMPVMIWLRADPWGEPYTGVAKRIYSDDKNLMWTEEMVSDPAYREDQTGYFNYSLAKKDIYGNKTQYWIYTEKLLTQCARQVREAIEKNPGYILGVTTTSEYRFLSKDEKYILDYNPNTIKEFRDFMKEKYGTVSEMNIAVGTSFKSWNLRSTDYDPVSVENEGGFDSPRTRFTPEKFWHEWTLFRAEQITSAVGELVRIIGSELDSKYIYTHQIPYNDHTTASPAYTGNIPGSNIGIDYFNHDITKESMNEISQMIGNDVTRTWGSPEWLVTRDATYQSTQTALMRMIDAGVKYLCPFNWGSGDVFDFKDSPSEKAIYDWVRSYENEFNILTDSDVKASSGFKGAEKLLDGSLSSGFISNNFQPNEWIEFDLKKETSINGIMIYPEKSKASLPDKITIYLKPLNGKEITYRFDLNDLDEFKPVCLTFDDIKIKNLKIEISEPEENAGEVIFSAAEICAGSFKQ